MVAHLLCKQGVRGSSPLASTEKEEPGPPRTGLFCILARQALPPARRRPGRLDGRTPLAG